MYIVQHYKWVAAQPSPSVHSTSQPKHWGRLSGSSWQRTGKAHTPRPVWISLFLWGSLGILNLNLLAAVEVNIVLPAVPCLVLVGEPEFWNILASAFHSSKVWYCPLMLTLGQREWSAWFRKSGLPWLLQKTRNSAREFSSGKRSCFLPIQQLLRGRHWEMKVRVRDFSQKQLPQSADHCRESWCIFDMAGTLSPNLLY